jgi:hypothetical protein
MEGFKNWVLNEMPANIRHLGQWDRQQTIPGFMDQAQQKKAARFKDWGWKWDDFNLLTNQAAVQKITRKWAKVKEDINFYVLRSPAAGKRVEVGQVDDSFLTRNLGLNVVTSPQEMKSPRDIYIDPHAINIIYTNNTGGERVPFTAWIAAHRLSHALGRRGKEDRGWQEFENTLHNELRQLMSEVYGRKLKKDYSRFDPESEKLLHAFATAIGTMKSAREGNMRNLDEFAHELMAQYIIEGRIRFNPLPKNFGKPGTFGRTGTQTYMRNMGTPAHDEEYTEYNAQLEGIAYTLEYYAENALGNAVGRIFVM